jgi:hypothetical protein
MPRCRSGARAALDESVLRNATSVTNFGVILGATLAAARAGRLPPLLPIPRGPALAALLGGLAMGYGARLRGTKSASFYGWVWLAAALAGLGAAVKLRPAFRLAVP